MASPRNLGESPKQYKARMAAYQRAYRVRRREAGNPIKDSRTSEQTRPHFWWKKYRMRPADVTALYESQGGACAICRVDLPPPGQGLQTHIDHDHASGKVRGILCSHCNLMLGHAQDDPERLLNALAYLKP